LKKIYNFEKLKPNQRIIIAKTMNNFCEKDKNKLDILTIIEFYLQILK